MTDHHVWLVSAEGVLLQNEELTFGGAGVPSSGHLRLLLPPLRAEASGAQELDGIFQLQ